MVHKRIFTTRKLALSELRKRRKKKDFESGVFKLRERKFIVGTFKQAKRTIGRKK